MTRLDVDSLRAEMGASPAPAASGPFDAYRADPVGFAVDVLGCSPWSKQADFMRAVATHDRVALRSGHKVGKSEALAAIAWWWVATRAEGRCILTAPTGRQVDKVNWRAIKALHRRARVRIDGVEVFDVPSRGVVFEDGREIVGFSTDEAERFAGISGAELLFLVDEASGVSPDIYEAIEGSCAGGAKIVLTGNPTRNAGPFFDAFHDSAELWHGLHISSEDSPTVTGERAVRGLATKAWIDSRRLDWGDNSPLFSIRVKGEWPAQASNAVVSIDLIERATRGWNRAAFDAEPGALVLGVDPARFGSDESVIFPVRGKVALPPIVRRGIDTVQLAQLVFDTARHLRRADRNPIERVQINVDETGLGGGVVDQLRAMHVRDIDVCGVNAGESPGNPQYARRRDELWMGIAEWLKTGGTLPGDAKLAGELAAVEYSFSSAGKILVEPKEELRKRLGRSPDRADALALAVFQESSSVPLYLAAMRAVRQEWLGITNDAPHPGQGGRWVLQADGNHEWETSTQKGEGK